VDQKQICVFESTSNRFHGSS